MVQIGEFIVDVVAGVDFLGLLSVELGDGILELVE